jgi:hypothetical protein
MGVEQSWLEEMGSYIRDEGLCDASFPLFDMRVVRANSLELTHKKEKAALAFNLTFSATPQ